MTKSRFFLRDDGDDAFDCCEILSGLAYELSTYSFSGSLHSLVYLVLGSGPGGSDWIF